MLPQDIWSLGAGKMGGGGVGGEVASSKWRGEGREVGGGGEECAGKTGAC